MKFHSEKDHRCHCGQLLAKLSSLGVELKCRRCKRIELIAWNSVIKGEDV